LLTPLVMVVEKGTGRLFGVRGGLELDPPEEWEGWGLVKNRRIVR
jgi:hypothetical protein